MGLTACEGQCEAKPGPDLNPHLLSANGLLYFNSPSSSSLYAINMSNGSIRWTNHISGADTMLDNNILYVYNIYTGNGNNSYDISAFNASDGTQLWQKNGRDGMYVSTLVAAQAQIAYIFTDNGTLMAVNGRNGSVLWQYLLKDDPASFMHDDPSTLQVIDGVVYVSTVNSSVFAFRERDGALLWQFNTPQDPTPHFLMATALGDGMIFINTDQITYVLRLSDGKLLWHLALTDLTTPSFPADGRTSSLYEANGLLYLEVGSHSFYALRARNGTQVWKQSFPPTNSSGNAQRYSMQLIDNMLYIFPTPGYAQEGAALHLFALRASDGVQLWEQPFQERLRVSLSGSQGVLSLFSENGLETLRETDGSLLWSRSFQQKGFLVTNDAIYVGTAGNTFDPCGPLVSAQLEQLRFTDAAPTWQIKPDPVPAPDTSLPAKIVLLILGSLLVLSSLLAFHYAQTTDKRPVTRS
jgi:outer membrane protein assembly factor BamB